VALVPLHWNPSPIHQGLALSQQEATLGAPKAGPGAHAPAEGSGLEEPRPGDTGAWQQSPASEGALEGREEEGGSRVHGREWGAGAA